MAKLACPKYASRPSRRQKFSDNCRSLPAGRGLLLTALRSRPSLPPDKACPKADALRSALIIGRNPLVGGQRESMPVWEAHGGSQRTSANDEQAGGKSGLAEQTSSDNPSFLNNSDASFNPSAANPCGQNGSQVEMMDHMRLSTQIPAGDSSWLWTAGDYGWSCRALVRSRREAACTGQVHCRLRARNGRRSGREGCERSPRAYGSLE